MAVVFFIWFLFFFFLLLDSLRSVQTKPISQLDGRTEIDPVSGKLRSRRPARGITIEMLNAGRQSLHHNMSGVEMRRNSAPALLRTATTMTDTAWSYGTQPVASTTVVSQTKVLSSENENLKALSSAPRSDLHDQGVWSWEQIKGSKQPAHGITPKMLTSHKVRKFFLSILTIVRVLVSLTCMFISVHLTFLI